MIIVFGPQQGRDVQNKRSEGQLLPLHPSHHVQGTGTVTRVHDRMFLTSCESTRYLRRPARTRLMVTFSSASGIFSDLCVYDLIMCLQVNFTMCCYYYSRVCGWRIQSDVCCTAPESTARVMHTTLRARFRIRPGRTHCVPAEHSAAAPPQQL